MGGNKKVSKKDLERGFKIMATAKALTDIYEEHFNVVSKYVHATSRGHEAIQIATGLNLKPQDFLCPYYRDDAMMLSIGMEPYDMMLQLMAKRDDPFSGGRSYYCHVSLKDDDKPKVPHQSSATGMQAIPATGVALGLDYRNKLNIPLYKGRDKAIVVCSLGDASVTEGEVSEAFQMAALWQLPIMFLIEDNDWDISAKAEEFRSQNAYDFIKGFHGIEARTIDGSDFVESFNTIKEVVSIMRKEQRPFLVHAKVPLLNHHTSGVRKHWYRDDLEEHAQRDPYPKLKSLLLDRGTKEAAIQKWEARIAREVREQYEMALAAPDPMPEDLFTHDFAPTPITREVGTRKPESGEETVMVDSALFAVKELMTEDDECLLYGQDVGARLGGVFREAAMLAQKFGNDRVFNTPIQEAFIVGSTVGMSAVGLKPIVEVQFADYIWPGLNQLFTEVSRSCYLSNGKWPVNMILRVPIGAYGSGGPYHSSSVESVVTNIRGIKIAYPCTGADLKGLMKAAYHDPNPCVIFEHKGLYWSKVPGTEKARTVMPAEDYILPFGKGTIFHEADQAKIDAGDSVVVITYGMGVHWATNAAEELDGRVEVIDLRTLYPLDEEIMYERVGVHNKCLVVTEEPVGNSFSLGLVAKVQAACFEILDAPVQIIGSEDMPAIPLNSTLEATMIPSTHKVKDAIEALLAY
jgi:2-oxoisovalerate dehydrogenase E1 component